MIQRPKFGPMSRRYILLWNSVYIFLNERNISPNYLCTPLLRGLPKLRLHQHRARLPEMPSLQPHPPTRRSRRLQTLHSYRRMQHLQLISNWRLLQLCPQLYAQFWHLSRHDPELRLDCQHQHLRLMSLGLRSHPLLQLLQH